MDIESVIDEERERWESLDRVIAQLPPVEQAQIYKLAQILDIKPAGSQDLIYRLLVGLGYHSYLVAGTRRWCTINKYLYAKKLGRRISA